MKNVTLIILIAFSNLSYGVGCHPFTQDGTELISVLKPIGQPHKLVRVPSSYKGNDFYLMRLALMRSDLESDQSFAVVDIKTESDGSFTIGKLYLGQESWLQATVTVYYGGICGLRYDVPVKI